MSTGEAKEVLSGTEANRAQPWAVRLAALSAAAREVLALVELGLEGIETVLEAISRRKTGGA